QTLRLWNTRSWQQVPGRHEHHSAVWSVEFSPDGKRFVSGGKDGTIKFWSANPPPAPITSLEIPPEFLHGPFSSDGQRMLTYEAKHRWSVWELDNAPKPRPLPITGERAVFAELAVDRYALVVTSDGVTTIWDQTGTRKIMAIPGPVPSSISRYGK